MIEHIESLHSCDKYRRATRASGLSEVPGSNVVGLRRVVSVSPFRCRVWALHDRLEEYLTEESCKSEIDSVAAHGQLVPVLGRPLRADPDHDVEIVCGARRLFVARHLGVPVRVELR